MSEFAPRGVMPPLPRVVAPRAPEFSPARPGGAATAEPRRRAPSWPALEYVRALAPDKAVRAAAAVEVTRGRELTPRGGAEFARRAERLSSLCAPPREDRKSTRLNSSH